VIDVNWMQRIEHIFSSKYILLFTAFSDTEYMNTIGCLDNAGIFHKTKIRGIYAISTRGQGLGRNQSQYDIYVRKEDEYKGHMALEQK
jgi:hypothetical protein